MQRGSGKAVFALVKETSDLNMCPIKGQMGAFKSLITLSNFVLSIALVCQSVQALNSFVSEFTLLTRKHDKLKYIGKNLLTTWVENPSVGPKRQIV